MIPENTDTPETDHLERNLGNAAHPVLSCFCRKLERELAAARETVESLTTTEFDLLTALGNARNERDEARGQRDRLAEALKMYGLGYTEDDLNQLATTDSQMGEITPDQAQREIKRREALQSLNQPKKMTDTPQKADCYPRLVRPSVFDEPPLHMDHLARNERLYKTLLGMGLYVEPIKGSEGGISKFIVSCGLTS